MLKQSLSVSACVLTLSVAPVSTTLAQEAQPAAPEPTPSSPESTGRDTPVAQQVSNPQIQAPAPEARRAPQPATIIGTVIRDVRIEGLQRIEPGTVFSYLPIQIGDRLTEQGTAEAVRVLFSTGFLRKCNP